MYLDKLSAEFHQLEKSGNLLVIASVDFSHYISDQRAKVHDLKSYYTLLHACTQAEYQTIEVDCPTCLFLVNSRAKSEKQYPQLIKRDSNSTIENKDLGVENTSRQFFIYTGQQSQDNGIVL
jgi:AmmeMemoRadiSam system protein B